MLARLLVPLLLFTIFLLSVWAYQDHAERRDLDAHEPPADDADAPDHEPPRELPVAA